MSNFQNYTCEVMCYTMKLFHNFFCCSSTRKVMIVCGPRRTKEGTNPLKAKPIPSCFTAVVRIVTSPREVSFEFMILVFTTSTGPVCQHRSEREQSVLHTAVATNPAIRDAVK